VDYIRETETKARLTRKQGHAIVEDNPGYDSTSDPFFAGDAELIPTYSHIYL
jgi:hypothetical protein